MHIIGGLMPRSLPATRQPVFWAALAFAAGILLGAYAWRPPLWWIAAAAAFLGAAAYFLRRRFAAAVALALGAFVGMGALSVELASAAGDPNELAAFCERGPVTVTGYLLRDGTSAPGRVRQPATDALTSRPSPLSMNKAAWRRVESA